MTRTFPLLLGALLPIGLALHCPAPTQAKTLAHWRFEGGRVGRALEGGSAVRDRSGGGNMLHSTNENTQPFLSKDVPLSLLPRNGASNSRSVEFRGNDELFSQGAPIDAFNFGPGGSNAWTVEFSVRLESFSGTARLLGRDGTVFPVTQVSPLQFSAVNPDGDDSYDLRLAIVDGAGVPEQIATTTPLQARRWYNVAATATGDQVQLFIDSLDGRGYQQVGSKSIEGALNAVPGRFTLGRGWNSAPAEAMSGRLDEVRISDTALSPSQFLFSTPTGGGAVAPSPKGEVGRKITLFPGADPHLASVGKNYYLYPTGTRSKSGYWYFYAYSSPDMKKWERSVPILNFKQIPWIYSDGNPNHYPWAPSLLEKDGKFYFYYSVGDQSKTPSRVGVGVADSPLGPFKDSGAPLVTGGNGFEAIDPMAFTDPKSGKTYLYVGGSNGAKLKVWLLSDDLTHTVREEKVEQPPKFTEGAFMHYANDRYYLSYSHGGWRSPSYSVHYATSDSPLGPWTYHGPILVSDDTRKGPGHHSFMQDPKTGRWMIAYHRWQNVRDGGDPFDPPGRSLAIEPIRYEKNGEIAPIQMNNDLPVLE